MGKYYIVGYLAKLVVHLSPSVARFQDHFDRFAFEFIESFRQLLLPCCDPFSLEDVAGFVVTVRCEVFMW